MNERQFGPLHRGMSREDAERRLILMQQLHPDWDWEIELSDYGDPSGGWVVTGQLTNEEVSET